MSIARKHEGGCTPWGCAAYPVIVLSLSDCSMVPPCQVLFSPPVFDPYAIFLIVAVPGIDTPSLFAGAPSCLGGSIRLVGNPVHT